MRPADGRSCQIYSGNSPIRLAVRLRSSTNSSAGMACSPGPRWQHESVAGGFSGIYPVLSQLEEAGKVRRGYFVEGLGGAQFALPGAVDRLRAPSDDVVVALAATDPANPYGAALEWPTVEEGRIGRIAGSQVILANGSLVAFVDGRKVRMFDADPALVHPVAAAIADIAARRGRATLHTVDGEPIAAAPLGRALTEFGFRHTHRGLRIDARR